jgi:hypothetical protein
MTSNTCSELEEKNAESILLDFMGCNKEVVSVKRGLDGYWEAKTKGSKHYDVFIGSLDSKKEKKINELYHGLSEESKRAIKAKLEENDIKPGDMGIKMPRTKIFGFI